jgi:Tol biopolymer transport system component
LEDSPGPSTQFADPAYALAAAHKRQWRARCPGTRRPGYFSDWRADGRRIAFDFFQRDGDVQIATARPDGHDLRVITSGPGIHEIPSWSPSGRRIVFGYSPEADPSTPGFETRLWTMRVDGSRARPLPMRRPGFDVEPKCSPNGRWIAFARLRPPTKRELQAALLIVRARAAASGV